MNFSSSNFGFKTNTINSLSNLNSNEANTGELNLNRLARKTKKQRRLEEKERIEKEKAMAQENNKENSKLKDFRLADYDDEVNNFMSLINN